MCSNLATNVFLPFLFFLVWFVFFLFFWVAFALMSFILATLQSCSVAVSNQIPSDVFVVQGNSPICLCVMYINVALYDIYIKPEKCWYLKLDQGLSFPRPPGGPVVFVSLLACEQRPKRPKRLFFWETGPSDLRPASVAASPVCMTRPQAGVITPVPSTVRSGISMTQTDRRRTS